MAKQEPVTPLCKEVVLRYLQRQYGEDREKWKEACKRALNAELPAVWREPYREILRELTA